MRLAIAVVAVAVSLALLLHVSDAVDRSKFRTCSQSPFCKRNREKAQAVDSARLSGSSDPRISTSRYQVNAGTLQLDQEKSLLTADLVDTLWPLRQPLLLTISILANNVVRAKVTEKNPIHKRFEVRDVLIEDGLKQGHAGLLLKQTPHPHAVFTFGDRNEYEVLVAVAPEPFKLTVTHKGVAVMQMNSLGYLNFEQYRNKNPRPSSAPIDPSNPESPPASVPEIADRATNAFPYDEEIEGAWEERFSSHTDSKPRGVADVSCDISFLGSQNLEVYGIPEHAASLALKTTTGDNAAYSDPYRLYNLDVFEYELDNPMALYGAIPFMMSHDEDRTLGVFWLNAAETFIDVKNGKDSNTFRKDVHWISESGLIDVFFFNGPNPQDVLFQYGTLTGFTALPQQFSIGYHQCRWNYKSEEDVKGVDGGFDEHDIPYDVLWLDIEHTDGKKYFTWDKANFPTPQDMQNNLAGKGRKMVTIVDPHIKRENGYKVFSQAQDKKYFVRRSGSDFDGWCWPGSSSYLDFFRPEVRTYWADLYSLSSYEGSTPNLFIWNDMNEPSVFNGPEVTMHKDAVHGTGDDEVEHRDVHNQYGFYVQMATNQGLVQRGASDADGPNRPFVLTRSFFSGSQRYGAMWTGDNKAGWDHLKAAQPMLLSLAIAGFSFVGADVGGFFGDPAPELLVRWYQAGAFQPFFRGHAHIDTKRREPWLFGEPYTALIRDAIRSRYMYLPYVYTAFHAASISGSPVMRPLWFNYPSEVETFKLEDEYLLGNDLLVSPVTSPGQDSTRIYLPGTQPWYDIKTGRSFAGHQAITLRTPIEKTPVLQRGGSIIPKKERARRSSSLMVHDPYTLVIALDLQGFATGSLYIDDGHSYNFQHGAFVHRTFNFQNGVLSSSATQSPLLPKNNGFQAKTTVERVVIYGYSQTVSKAVLKASSGSQDLITLQTLGSGETSSEISRVEIRKPDVSIDVDWTIELVA